MRRAEKLRRKTEWLLSKYWIERNRMPYWRLAELRRLQRNEEFTLKHSRPKHDALVARMVAHREEVKALRR
jgi:hypothetical protein